MDKRGSVRLVACILAGSVIAIGFLALIIFNMRHNDEFFNTSATSCISIVIAVYISYYLTQRQNDKRKRKDIMLSVLTAIQTLICDRDAFIVTLDTDPNSLTMRTREISNRVIILGKYKGQFGLEEEVNFIAERFKEYEEFIGDHICKIDYLKDSEKELRRPLDLINGKLVEMMLKMYA